MNGDKLISTIVGIVVVAFLLGNLAPTLITALDNISGSGLPLAGVLGGAGGLIALFLMINVLRSSVKTKGK